MIYKDAAFVINISTYQCWTPMVHLLRNRGSRFCNENIMNGRERLHFLFVTPCEIEFLATAWALQWIVHQLLLARRVRKPLHT
mmetsp:Transcript_3362/g.5848  ORF Transcript_3362/g.5848 Transcript_3362/m.5848 type:complete len:83 (-) Transcript_3362:567-815(-)